MERVSFEQLGIAVAILLLLIPAVISIASFLRTPKRQVSFETEYATRDEVEQVRADVQVVDEKVEALRGDIVRNGETRRIAIENKVEEARCESREGMMEVHKEISGLASDMAEMKGETKIITQQLARMEMRSGRTGI